MQFRVGRIGSVDAYRMIQNFKIIADEFLHDQKVAHHFVPIEMLGLKDELHFARVTMRKFALAGMLRQHVAALDIDCLANAIWHFGQQIDLLRRGKCNLFPPNFPMIPWKQSRPGNDLQDGDVHLWRVGLDVSDAALCRLRGMLSDEETHRSERFRFPVLQRRFAAGRGALRAILAGYLSMEPEKLKFACTAYGKPFLLNSPANIQFNLSHSGGLMVAAVCLDWSIGVDIEKEDLRLHPLEIAERYFCDREREEIAKADTSARLQVFFQLWTAKEAVLKATSLGLAIELSKLEVGLAPLRVIALEDEAKIHGASWHLVGFRPGDDYSGTLAVAGVPSQLEYRDFDLPS